MGLTCARCQKDKRPDEFALCKRNSSGRQSYCRTCTSDYRRENKSKIADRKKANRAADPDKYLDEQLRGRYGITLETYRAIAHEQGGLCAICRQPPRDKGGKPSRLSVDHDHTCCPDAAKSCGDCVRGLLCWHCNFALGLLADDLERVTRLENYLKEYRTSD